MTGVPVVAEKQDTGGKRVACEVLVVNDAARNIIRRRGAHLLRDVIRTGKRFGMFSMEQSVGGLVAERQVSGDFTTWEPVAMSLRGNRWQVEIDVATGTHHFGFLIDDEWYVPDDAPDGVLDEWGRTNATLVIEGDEQ